MIIDIKEIELIKLLKRYGVKFEKKVLPVFDVIIGDYGFELKRGNDFLVSIFDNRIFEQIRKMKLTGLKFAVLVYRFEEVYLKAKNRNIVTGMILSLYLQGIPIIPLGTTSDIVYFLDRLNKAEDITDDSYDFNWNIPKFKNNYERKVASLSCAKDVGVKKAMIVLENLKTIKKIALNIDEIDKIDNIGPATKKGIEELLSF